MRILFISLTSLFNSYSCSLRNYSLVLGLLQNGQHVDVLTFPCEVNNLRFKKFLEYPNCNVIFFPLTSSLSSKVYSSKSNSFLLKIARLFYSRLALFEYTPSSIWKLSFLHIFNSYSYDILISSSDPKISHHFSSRLLHFFRRKPFWIQYWGDPFTNDISSSRIYPQFFLRLIERSYLSYADMNIFASPLTCSLQQKQYPILSHKFYHLPTPTPSQEIPKLPNNKFKVSYHGTYSPFIRNIVPLLEAFTSLPSCYQLEIIGPETPSIVNSYSDLPNVSFLEHQQDLTPFLETTNLLVVVLNKRGTQIPGKLYHYSGINRPILICLDGENSTTICTHFEQYNRFYTVDNTSTDIAEMILSISHQSKFDMHNPFEPQLIASNLLHKVRPLL